MKNVCCDKVEQRSRTGATSCVLKLQCIRNYTKLREYIQGISLYLLTVVVSAADVRHVSLVD